MQRTLFAIVLSLVSTTALAKAKDPETKLVEQQLKGEGVVGRIHGAIHDRNVYVFTWRKDGDFFAHREFPVVPANAEVAAILKTLKRHDGVRITGEFIANGAPQVHILAKEIEVLQVYPGRERNVPPNNDLAELLSKKEAVGKVHAVGGDGHVLVFEYKSVIVPVVAPRPSLTKGLYRSDKIRIRYTIEQSAHRPPHLYLDAKAKKPLVVVKRITEGNGKPVTLEGELVLFPQSPQIKFDIYALRTTDADGVSVEYTLVNFESMDVFQAIRAKLAAAWTSDYAHVLDGRNKLVNPHLHVKATGTLNVQDPGQANPQILLTSPDDVTVTRQ